MGRRRPQGETPRDVDISSFMGAWSSFWSGPTSGPLGLVRRIVVAVHEDAVYDVAAGLAFYALMAVVPFLLLCSLLVGVFLDEQPPETLARLVALVTPAESTLVPETIKETIHSLASSARGGFLIVTIGVAAWTASKATWAMVRALNRVFHTKETRPLLVQRVMALAVTAAAGALAAVVVLVEATLPIVTAYLPALDLGIVRLLRVLVMAGLATVVWTALYRVLPAHPPRLGIPSAGSAVGVAGWMLATWGFSAYLDHVKDLGAVYGTLGGLLVFLLWLWLSCFAMLGGALVDRLRADGQRTRATWTGAPDARKQEG
jgi:membrane protein